VLTVWQEIAFRSWCLSWTVRGKQSGRLKSPTNSWRRSSEQLTAHFICTSFSALLLPRPSDEAADRDTNDVYFTARPLSAISVDAKSPALPLLLLPEKAISLLQCLLDTGKPGLSEDTNWSAAVTASHEADGSMFSWSSSKWLKRLFGRDLTLRMLPLLLSHVSGDDIKLLRVTPATVLCSGLVSVSELPVFDTTECAYAMPALSHDGI